MIKNLFLSILAVFVLVEEWLWDILATIAYWLSVILHLKRFDAWLSSLNPLPALCAFFIPLIIVTPFNLLALFLLAHGAIIQGVILELIIKLVGTLLIARVFRLTKPALLTFTWLSWIYNTVTHLLTWAHTIIHQTLIYKLIANIKTAIKIKIANWFN